MADFAQRGKPRGRDVRVHLGGFGGRLPKGPAGTSQGPIRTTGDVSELLNKLRNGTVDEKKNAVLELVRKVMDKEGDFDSKRTILFNLTDGYVKVISWLLGAGSTEERKATAEAIADFGEAVGANKDAFTKIVIERFGITNYTGDVLEYRLLLETKTPAKAFAEFVSHHESDPRYIRSAFAPLVAMEVRGAGAGFTDAAEYFASKNVLTHGFEAFGALLVLFNTKAEIPKPELEGAIRQFLETGQCLLRQRARK